MARARWAKPQVWNSGAAMWVRQPYFRGIEESSDTAASRPASLRGAPFGVPVVPEVRMMIRPCRSGGVRSRESWDSISDSSVATSPGAPAAPSSSVQPITRDGHVGVGDQSGELLVVDDHLGLVALEHLDELGAGEGRVEVDRVGAQLGHGDAGVDEPAVVAAHDGHAVSLAHAQLAQRAGQRVRPLVQLAEGQLAELVDQADLVGDAQCERGETPGRTGAPVLQGAAQPGQGERRVGTDDAGPTEHLDRGAGGDDSRGQLS